MEEMDVEGVTQVLQGRNRHREDNGTSSREHSVSSNASNISPSQNDVPTSPTAGPSIIPQPPSMEFQTPLSDTETAERPTHERMGESSLSWVEQFTATSSSSVGAGSPSIAEAQLSDSMISGTLSSTSEVLSDFSQASSIADRYTGRTKGELWKDVKYLTFARTLTIIYATSLLTILTHIQLNLIGRTKYLASVAQMGRMEHEEEDTTIGSLFWETVVGTFFDGNSAKPEATTKSPSLSEETERKYLLLSWWLTHRGWRQVGHAIRQAVEGSLASVSLKSKIDTEDIRRIFNEARSVAESRVSEDQSQRLHLPSILFPPDSDSLDQTLSSGGTPHHLLPANRPDKDFESLVSESRQLILTPSFEAVFEASLETSFSLFFSFLEKEVFGVNATTGEPGKALRLVDVLPGMARWSRIAISGIPNELIDSVSGRKELTEFSALIYSSYEGISR